jgi:hypothetical protein
VLDDGVAAAVHEVAEPARAVVVGAGEHHAHRAVAIRVGRGDERHVDGRAAEAHRGLGGQGEVAVVEQQMVVRWSDVHVRGGDGLLVVHLAHAQMGVVLQQLGEQPVGFLGAVLHDHHRRHEVAREPRDDRRERVEPAPRRADDDHPVVALAGQLASRQLASGHYFTFR